MFRIVAPRAAATAATRGATIQTIRLPRSAAGGARQTFLLTGALESQTVADKRRALNACDVAGAEGSWRRRIEPTECSIYAFCRMTTMCWRRTARRFGC